MDEKKTYPLGVLFVHGIGEQPRDDTLLAFGEPLIRTLDRWLQRRTLGRTKVVDSKLSDTQLDPGEPAHSVIQIVRDKKQDGQKWLLAESWWADEFRRPPFMKLPGWLITIGPWAIISHAN